MKTRRGLKSVASFENAWRMSSHIGRPARGRVLLAFLAALVLGAASSTFGLGSRIPNQDAYAIARGNAFVATADDPAAIYYNPAGITQLEGQHVQAGALIYVDVKETYESPAGVRTYNDPQTIAAPQLHYTYSFKEAPVSLGLGVYSPFGLGMKWPDDAPFRTAGIEAKLEYLTINPVVAWKPFSQLSIAAGPTISVTHVNLRQGVPLPPFLPPAELQFKGDGSTYGFDAGILWQPHAKWSFGVKYMSTASADYDGTVKYDPQAPYLPPDMDTKTHIKFPQFIVGGVSFRPTRDWNIEFDVDWTDWHRVKDVVIDGVGTTPLNWQSSFFYYFGVTRQLPKGYYISAGYFFSENSTSDQNYTPLVPDTDIHVGSLGVGRRGEHWDWALAGQLFYGPFHEVSGAANPTVDGSYKLFTPGVSFSVGYHF
jgi:long-chain fatty acid transport protein